MKNFLLITCLFISTAIFAQEPKKNIATVQQYSGLYVFVLCEPVMEYEHIATIKKTFVAETVMEFMQKAATLTKKEHPDADAIIFHNVQVGFTKDNWDVIRFKK